MQVEFTKSERHRHNEAYGNPDEENAKETARAGNAMHDLYTGWLEQMETLLTEVLDDCDLEWKDTKDTKVDARDNLESTCTFGCCINRGFSLYRAHPSPNKDRWIRLDAVTNSHFSRITRSVHYQNGHLVQTSDEARMMHDTLEELGESVRDGDEKAIRANVDRMKEILSAMYRRTSLLEERWVSVHKEERERIKAVMVENGWKIHSEEEGRNAVFEWNGETGTDGRHGVEVEHSVRYNDRYFESLKPEVGVEEAVNINLYVRGLNPRYLDSGEGFCHGGYGSYATEIVAAKGIDGLPDAATVCRFAIAQVEGVVWDDPTRAERLEREREARRRWEEERRERMQRERERRFEQRAQALAKHLGLSIEKARQLRRDLDEAADVAHRIEQDMPPLEVERA